jgi:hypothetical protein
MKNILSLVLVSILLLSFISDAQDITSTLAPNGSFKVKDNSNEFLSVDQSTGNLRLFRNLVLPSNSTNSGVIFIDTTRFLHFFGVNNFFLGKNAGNNTLTTANLNTAVGTNSLKSLTSGNNNSAFGYNALYSNTTGNDNSAFGYLSLQKNTTGNNGSAFGYNALSTNTTGNDNSAFGSGALRNNTYGYSNSAFGSTALYVNTTGSSNSAFGNWTLAGNTTGNENSAFGYNALSSNTTGNYNSALGFNSLLKNKTGYQNTAVGHHSLENNIANYNTAIGYNAGSTVTTGTNLTLVGIDANPSSPTATNQITLGNQYISSLRCNVQTITSLSDIRDKKNIEDLSVGLNLITKLKPRQFNWDRRDWYSDGNSDGSKMQDKPTAGFIAQELDEVQTSEDAEWLNLVLKDNPEKWEATYGNLLPVIVKAVQELNNKNEQLRTEKDEQIAELSEENNKLRSEVEELRTIKEQLSEIQNLKTELIEQIKLLKEDDNTETKFSSVIK